MAKTTTCVCDICGRNMTDELVFGNKPCICGTRFVAEEGGDGIWHTLDICLDCREKLTLCILNMRKERKRKNDRRDSD